MNPHFRVCKAMIDEARKTTVMDLVPILKTAGKVVAAILLLGTGNIIMIGMAIWYYRSWSARQPAQAQAQAQPQVTTANGRL